MGKELYEAHESVRTLFKQADELLGFSLTATMFEGTAEALKQTKVTQPAVFLHSVAAALTLPEFKPEMVAGHSLGEFSALTAAGALRFEDALSLVYQRALAMQEACEINPSGMAAILGLEDTKVEEICAQIDGIVVAANYNCPGQLVISGANEAVAAACEALKAAGAKRALPLPVGGAFHSPLMAPAQEKLERAIEKTTFHTPTCPIYQNVSAQGTTDIAIIKENLKAQLTGPVRWTQSVQQMIADGATSFTECGPGNVLQGLVKKIDRQASTSGVA
ncbi:malonyl CoA-ACP transacylase [Nitritalea halalkaliphila LW7]|uniref:Malonyl CoA-acyl carrier protein transacylase n=1 Tax=Nitritalea halalkaliphila LW7 TaxID=1189621 RepID=I5BY27_9BACT|nr:malonyl CoA-ACP transacylase [Nitritalea halalkaliphila LW7]